jgi:hypothetical protein
MKKSLATAAFVAVCTGAASTFAAPPNVTGSDTLEAFTRALITGNCAGALAGGFGYSSGTGSPGPIIYVGGGSGVGQTDMLAANVAASGMYAAPMSRPLNSSGGGCAGNTTSEGIAVAADALAILVDSAASESCGGGHPARAESNGRPTTEQDTAADDSFADLRYSGAVAGSNITDWRHVLRLVYFGIPATIAPSEADAVELAGRDCNSTLRRDFTANYANLFQDGCTAGSCNNQPLKHAFRRGDTSGTTDTFISLLGAPAVLNSAGAPQRPFCNGLENEDLDPVRRTCTQDEQVCEANGTLGLVLPIVIPSLPGVAQADQPGTLYNADPTLGAAVITQFGPKFAPAPTCTAAPTNCPGCTAPTVNALRCSCEHPTPGNFPAGSAAALAYTWNLRYANNCWTGAKVTGTATRFGTVNGDDGVRDNSPAPWGTRTTALEAGKQRCCSVGGQAIVMDPRVLNLTLRNPTTGALISTRVPASPAFPAAPAFYRLHTNAFGRSAVARTTVGLTAANAICQKLDATRQIGCLVQQDAPILALNNSVTQGLKCSTGFAGFEAANSNLSDQAPTPFPAHAEPLALNAAVLGAGADPEVNNVVTSTGFLGTYALKRYLWLNSYAGFGNAPLVAPGSPNNPGTFQEAQFNLARCFANAVPGGSPTQNAIANVIDGEGFFPLPGGAKICRNMCALELATAGACNQPANLVSATSEFSPL